MSLKDRHLSLLRDLLTQGIADASERNHSLMDASLELGRLHTLPTLTQLPQKRKAWRKSEIWEGAAMAFSGPFSGRALILFPAHEGPNLVRLMFGDAVESEALAGTNWNTDLLCELGSTVLSSCLTQLSDIFGHGVHKRNTQPLTTDLAEMRQSALYVPVKLRRHKEELWVALAIEVISLRALALCIDAFLERVDTGLFQLQPA